MQFTVDTDLAIAGVVLGLAAIFMAAPPLLQMLCGRPRLEFAADEFTGPDGKQLIITIKNKTIETRFLRRLGVTRETGNVLAYFDIQEQGTNKFIQRDVSALLQCAPTRESLILARALPAFTVGISVVHTKDQTTWVIDARSDDGNYKTIGVGDYTAQVTIVCGEQVS